jgi:transposase
MSLPVLPFVLPGCMVDEVSSSSTTVQILAHTTTFSQPCPTCGTASARVHSRYLRRLRDLPAADQSLELLLRVRRFRCTAPACSRCTFTERLPDLAPVHAQRTRRFTASLRDVGFACGGETGARLAERLRMRTSGDTILRILRATPPLELPPAEVVGIDDFALRKGRVYGTIVVDLARHRIIDLLPDRTADTVATRLRAEPHVTIIARDRAQDYALGASAGAPDAVHVVDRCHLLVNVREAVERYVQRMRPALRRLLVDGDEAQTAAPDMVAALDAPPAPQYDPGPARERRQAERHAEREQRFRQVHEAHSRGLNLRQIAREVGLSVATVRLWLRADVLPPERRGYRRRGKVHPYASYLLRRLSEGCTNQTRLWQEITAQGFTGGRSLVAKWIRAHRPEQAKPVVPPMPLPGPKELSWPVLQAGDETLAPEDRALWDRLQQHDELIWLQQMVARFRTMVRERRVEDLDPWLVECHAGSVAELRNFATSLEKEDAGVRAALTLAWSSGPVEGSVNKLKFIKRSGYGRMKLDLLKLRVLNAA